MDRRGVHRIGRVIIIYMEASAQAWIMRSRFFAATIAASAFFFLPAFAHAASLFISPAVETVSVGQTFTLGIEVSSPDVAMNAASGDISFPSTELQVLSVSKANSVMGLWIRDPSFTNSQAGGDVHFEGIVLNPGFTGSAGNLVTITFQAVAAGNAPITFSSGAVLANDGNGTNILTATQSGSVTIVSAAPSLSSPSYSTPALSGAALGPTTIKEVPNQDPTDPRPIFIWNATGTGGAIKYTVRIGHGHLFDASTILVPNTTDQYRLPLQAPASSTNLTVIARDVAGDVSSSSISFSIAPIATPLIEDFTHTVPSSAQLFSAEGTAATGTTVIVYLEKAGSLLAYSAETDANGHWGIAEKEAMSPGTWELHAQAMDARGALSGMTAISSVQVNGWFNDLFSTTVQWGAVILLMIFLLACIVFVALNIVHQIRKWRISSNKEVLELEGRLRRDLDRIEKELNKKIE
jgi:hypothetical protein